MTWFVYVLECGDGTLYTGITTDLERRVDEHNTSTKGARYTRARRPVRLLASWIHDDRAAATQAEARLKRLPRREKLARIAAAQAEQSEQGEEDP